jgi:putative spermidine/putrescine transport system substrate-binding protein
MHCAQRDSYEQSPESVSKRNAVKDRRTAAKNGPSRRALLKAGGALLGGAAGAGAITGFPTIWAQEIKDIELRHVGVSYSVVKAIGDSSSSCSRRIDFA